MEITTMRRVSLRKVSLNMGMGMGMVMGGGAPVKDGNCKKRRQTRSFYSTANAVKRIETKEDTGLPLLQCVKLGGMPTVTKASPCPTEALRGCLLKCHLALIRRRSGLSRSQCPMLAKIH
jgi:hypothetical protein